MIFILIKILIVTNGGRKHQKHPFFLFLTPLNGSFFCVFWKKGVEKSKNGFFLFFDPFFSSKNDLTDTISPSKWSFFGILHHNGLV